MAPGRPKPDITTFKVDASLGEAMRGIPNRSEFIRAAVLAPLENVCPLCEGTGLLSPNPKKHWQAPAATHPVGPCGECHETHLVCKSGPRKHVHGHKGP
jgi:hypothetical protein